MNRASEITPGTMFRKNGQNAWREAKSVSRISPEADVPNYQKGKILVVVSTRKKIFFSSDEKLHFQTRPIPYKSLSNN